MLTSLKLKMDTWHDLSAWVVMVIVEYVEDKTSKTTSSANLVESHYQ
jgi:hypothetical protein